LIATWMGIVTIAARNHFGQSDNKPHIADEPGKMAHTENSPSAEPKPNNVTTSAIKYDATCPNCGKGVPLSATECRHCRTTYLGAYRPSIVEVSKNILENDANSAQATKPSASYGSSSEGASRFKKIVKFCVIAAMAAVVGRFIGYAIYDANKSKEQVKWKLALNENLQIVAAKANKGLPSYLNGFTRFDRVTSGSETMTLSHTILDWNHWSREDKDRHMAELPRRVCVDEGMKAILKAGATVIYAYSDKSGAPLFVVPMRIDDCR
jgi:hypothetical protein